MIFVVLNKSSCKHEVMVISDKFVGTNLQKLVEIYCQSAK